MKQEYIDHEVKLPITKALKCLVKNNRTDISIKDIIDLISTNDDLDIKSELVYTIGYKIQNNHSCLENEDYTRLSDTNYCYDETDISYISTQLLKEFQGEFVITGALGMQSGESLKEVLTRENSNTLLLYKDNRKSTDCFTTFCCSKNVCFLYFVCGEELICFEFELNSHSTDVLSHFDINSATYCR